MSRTIKGNGKHLTYSDRVYIEQELMQRSSFRSIASALGKDPSTISKEIRLHYATSPNGSYRFPRCNYCKHFKTCKDTVHICYTCENILCYKCEVGFKLAKNCKDYNPFTCPKLSKPPYVCNGCEKRNTCHGCKRYYRAKQAHKTYEEPLTETRSGINMTPEELTELNDLISPLILKGQPLSHIFAIHGDEIPVCRRTLYNYLDKRVFQARNIDLPRRVRYQKKRQTTPRTKNIEQVYRNRRTCKDFERFMEAHPDFDVVEMDTVKGSRSSAKCLLTLLFRSCNFMLIILLPKCTQECVVNAINSLTKTIGLRLFKKYFPVILTDNGSEFKNPYDIEKTKDGKCVMSLTEYYANQAWGKKLTVWHNAILAFLIQNVRSSERLTPL